MPGSLRYAYNYPLAQGSASQFRFGYYLSSMRFSRCHGLTANTRAGKADKRLLLKYRKFLY